VVQSEESLRPLYRLMVGSGVVAVLILALGLATILKFAPPGQASGLKARIVGVYPYDPAAHMVTGQPSTHFSRTQPFAAKVDWSALPGGVVVGARWYNTLDQPVGGVGPAAAASLATTGALVPVMTPPGLHANLPGNYTLAVTRYSQGQPVELLGREVVLVERSG
jgi:hypothetical protein